MENQIQVLVNEELREEIEQIAKDAAPEGKERYKGSFIFTKRMMWKAGHAVLRYYPELREYRGAPGRPNKMSEGEGGVTFSSVAAATGYDRRRIKGWVETAIDGGDDEESFTAWIEPIAEVAAERTVSKVLKAPEPEIECELPEGEYEVIYADPPWEYRNSGFQMSAANHYPTMPTDKIASLEVPSAENSVCFMWVTNPLLEDGLQVLSGWGFDYKTCMVWVKDRHTAGFYVYGQHELLLIGVKGSGMTPLDDGKPKSVIYGSNKEHSRKPDEMYEIIEAMYPGSRKLEMFARRTRDGWEAFGNEV